MANSDRDGSDAAVGSPATPRGISESRGPQQSTEIQVDVSHALTSYANFCRVTGTPEELIIDFGLNPQPTGVPSQPIVVTQRVVTNPVHGKAALAGAPTNDPTTRKRVWCRGD